MTEYRGVVVHIAAGYFEGTISWQRNPTSKVSSHFIIGRDGQAAQMVDTDVVAWTQGDGNGHWLSMENEGFLLGHPLWKPGWHQLSAAMIEKNARLLARAHTVYKVPLQLATSPTGRGLGYHSMGAENGFRWGHSACPGQPIKDQLPLILARAIEIVNGEDDEIMTPAQFVALLQDPTVAANMRALPWQYNGRGIEPGKSTLGVLNDIHVASKRPVGQVTISDAQLPVLADLLAERFRPIIREEIDATRMHKPA